MYAGLPCGVVLSESFDHDCMTLRYDLEARDKNEKYECDRHTENYGDGLYGFICENDG